MSGVRCFREIRSHLNTFPGVRYFYFLDPLLNGNIRELHLFCDLIADAAHRRMIPAIQWSGNGIIRREMTSALLHKMRAAGCVALAYGIESGSQRVLDLMRKRFKVADAEAVIRATHEAGIEVSLNFMFGFPGEIEADFQETIGFLRRNSGSIDKVMPSDSFCYIDKGTYLYEHGAEFGVEPDPHTAFWKTIDGSNTYPGRLNRFERFCEVASSLGLGIGAGREKVKLFKEKSLGQYRAHAAGVKI